MQHPFFRKKTRHGVTDYFALITSGFVYKATSSDDFSSMTICPKSLNGIQGELREAYGMYNDWVMIEEDQFFKGWADIHKSMSLEPVLQENNPDDLKNVL